MFKNLFGKKSNDSGSNQTGFYKVDGNKLIELEERPGIGSINDTIEYLGYDTTQIHTVNTFDSTTIEVIGVKIFTKDPVFVWAKEKNTRLDFKSLTRELKNTDWSFEYSSHTIEDILTDGIEVRSLTFEYLSSILQLKKESDNLFHAPSINLYLNFSDGYLESYTSSDWTNAASKWVKDANEELFDNMLSEAIRFHRNEIEAMEEVNLVCEALQGIPNATQNEFISLHRKPNGNISFFNLLAVHYNSFEGERIKIDEFKTVNKGRFVAIEEHAFEVDQFIFHFDTEGFLTDSMEK